MGDSQFPRAEDIYAVMVAQGDGDKPVWATEFGWLLESPGCSASWETIGFASQQVTAGQQAAYLAGAFAYADAYWPWMQVMIVSNLDFAVMTGWYATCDPLRWFGVLEPDKTPRPAYTALAQMEKRPRSWEAWGMAVEPTALAWMMDVADTRWSQTVTVRNTGGQAFGLTVTQSPGGDGAALSVAVQPATGDCDTSFHRHG